MKITTNLVAVNTKIRNFLTIALLLNVKLLISTCIGIIIFPSVSPPPSSKATVFNGHQSQTYLYSWCTLEHSNLCAYGVHSNTRTFKPFFCPVRWKRPFFRKN